jgi:hypothetical protein
MITVTIWRTWSIWSQQVFFLLYEVYPRTVMCSGYVYLCHRPLWLVVSRDFEQMVMVTIWRTWSIWSQQVFFLSYFIHPRTVMCSGYVYLRHKSLWLCVSRDAENKWSWWPYGEHGPYGPKGLFSPLCNTYPNSYVLGVCISLSQTIMALCVERCWKINGHDDHMENMVHMVPKVFFLRYVIYPRTVMCSGYVYLCHRPLWLCVSRDFEHMVMVTIWRTWSIWSQKVFFLRYFMHPRTVMCSSYVYLCHRPLWLCVSRDI